MLCIKFARFRWGSVQELYSDCVGAAYVGSCPWLVFACSLQLARGLMLLHFHELLLVQYLSPWHLKQNAGRAKLIRATRKLYMRSICLSGRCFIFPIFSFLLPASALNCGYSYRNSPETRRLAGHSPHKEFGSLHVCCLDWDWPVPSCGFFPKISY